MSFYKIDDKAMLRGSFNGIVSVEKNGISIFEKVHNNLPVENPTSKSLFFIGSITKQMLAAIILKYIELGILDLYAPISNYLTLLEDVLGANSITLENLLTHTSGLVESRGRKNAVGYNFNLKMKGTFLYANQGYELAGKIVTKISGKSLESLYQELFYQCDMKDSFIINNDDCDISTIKETHPRLIQGYMFVPPLHSLIMSTGILTDAWNIKSGYSLVKQPFKDGFQYLYPQAGNVVSTIQDLHKWNHCFGKIFKENLTMQEYVKSRVFNIKCDGRLYDFCLGMRKTIQEPIEYGQSGWIYGYQSTSVFFPEQRISAVIFENVSRIGGIRIPPLDFSIHNMIVANVRSYINAL
ncbi:MAG TPA: serine hydrolase [Parachlamydiaceae bacterium]|nr:serine hydrolase [Parachlamydiaceae bacterium]HEV8052226.1 serine hydrolase [Parachlamydiaceae bacterium]